MQQGMWRAGGWQFGLRGWCAVGLAAALTTLVVLLTGGQAQSADTSCKGGERSTIDVGIARADACWTKSGTGEKTIYKARWIDQPVGVGVDLNGFVLGRAATGGGSGITFNPATREVESDGNVVLYSRNWPKPGLNALGTPFPLEFVAPKPATDGDAELTIEDLEVNATNIFKGTLAGLFAPVLNVESPTKITEDGKGSIGLTVQLSGIFTLKGKSQTGTLEFNTELGKGTTWDGFSLELNEIDSLKVVTLENFNAYYSASKEAFGGEATVRFPFTKPLPPGVAGPQEQKETKGFKAGFGVTKGRLTGVSFGVSGLKIPVGSAGFLTSIEGGGEWAEFPNMAFKAAIGATFGPELPVPWGPPAAPIGVTGSLSYEYKNKEIVFITKAGLSLFNIPLGSAYLGIYTQTGVQFGAGIGIGVPSLRDKPSDPFYVGARVDGWIAKGRFQFTGNGRIRVFNVPLLDAQAMVSTNVIGACAKMFWFNVGAVYTFKTKRTETFGKSCGLERYKEKFPGTDLVSASASTPRFFRLNGREAVLEVSGKNGAPRFSLSSGGKVIKVPASGTGVKRDDYAIFIDEAEGETHVLLRRPKGTWRITPYSGSPAITGLRSGQPMPEEKVEARLVGRGTTRTLIWDSKGQPDTSLVFTEEMKGGVEHPILTTGKTSGKRKVTLSRGGLFGKRKLKVLVLHGDAPRDEEVVDRYVVKAPPPPKAPARVRGWRNEHDAVVTWSRVRGAANYYVQVKLPGSRTWKNSYARLVGARSSRVLLEDFPSGTPGRHLARARVVAINQAGRSGRPGQTSFRTDPGPIGLRAAATATARSAHRRGNGVTVRSTCVSGGHCLVKIKLLHGKRVIGLSRFQQVPDTYRHLKVHPRSKKLRKRLAHGRLRHLRIVATITQGGKTFRSSKRL